MKTVIITGVSHGLGQVIARRFLEAGWGVVGTGRSVRPEGLEDAIDYHQFDASDSRAVEDFWKQFSAKRGDGEVCLVNNAGSYIQGGVAETAPEGYESQMRSNYFSGVFMTQGLIANVPRAKIFNIISASALAPHASTSAYGASKAASMHFFKALQAEVSPEQYQITNFYPSDIATSGPDPKAIDPADLASLILELAESRASYYLRDASPYPVQRKESP